ncbi:MAG: hypothetical protein ACOC95_05280 [Planctomycetota bacterium]
MTRIFTTLIALVAMTGAATAQSADSYTGRITRDNVYIRSGGSQNYYPVMKLSAPAPVEVVGRAGDWLKIAPPAGAFSLVAKRYVDAEGQIGTVTGDRVTVRTGSLEQPSMMTTVQGYLSSGGTVRIVGQTEEYYKIAPPAGTVLYVYAAYVERVDEDEPDAAAPATAEAVATTQPAAPATQPAATRPAEPVEPTAEQKRRARIEAFKILEEALIAEWDKPLEERDLEGFLERYRALDVPADSPLARQVDYRLRFLEQAIQRRRGAREVEAMGESARRQRRLLIAGLRGITGEPREIQDIITVTGQLSASLVYQGLGGTPKRWVLADAQDPSQLMYVESDTAATALNRAIGWKVRLTGKRVYDAKIQAHVLHVRDIERLTPVPTARATPTQPASPTPTGDAPYPRAWSRPETPEPAKKASPEAEDVPAPADDLPVVPATQPAPAVVNPEEYR